MKSNSRGIFCGKKLIDSIIGLFLSAVFDYIIISVLQINFVFVIYACSELLENIFGDHRIVWLSVSIRMETSSSPLFNRIGKELLFVGFSLLSWKIFVYRTVRLTPCRFKSANLQSRNYYELLGVEKTATQKEIKQAFFKLSKEV